MWSKLNNMKNLITFLIAVVFITSCKKSAITPGNYKAGTPPATDTSHWQTQYGNGGVIPTSTTTPANNNLVGTNWVLTDVYNNYAHVAKHDTIHFISNTNYQVGSNPTKFTYSLYTSMGNGTIDLHQFNPINGLYLSANNFNPSAFTTTPKGGTILLSLKDNFNSTNNIYVSTFKKI